MRWIADAIARIVVACQSWRGKQKWLWGWWLWEMLQHNQSLRQICSGKWVFSLHCSGSELYRRWTKWVTPLRTSWFAADSRQIPGTHALPSTAIRLACTSWLPNQLFGVSQSSCAEQNKLSLISPRAVEESVASQSWSVCIRLLFCGPDADG